MKLISRLIFSFISNLLALLAAAYFVQGFKLVGTIQNILGVTLIFTLLNLLVRPIIKLILSPIIILTFGLAIIVINALMLYILKAYLTTNLIITGLKPLIYATLIISLVNIIFHALARKSYRD